MTKLACCGECYSIGCYTHCDEVDTGLLANETGVFTVFWTWKGQSFKEETDVILIGEPIIVDNIFNEASKVKFQILDPSLNQYTHTDGGTIYEHFCLTNLVESAKTLTASHE